VLYRNRGKRACRRAGPVKKPGESNYDLYDFDKKGDLADGALFSYLLV